MKNKKIASVSKNCVACGCCAKICPINAIFIYKGIYASVDKEKCVGCGKCANICPAQIINIIEQEEYNEKKMA